MSGLGGGFSDDDSTEIEIHLIVMFHRVACSETGRYWGWLSGNEVIRQIRVEEPAKATEVV